ncbi:MAG TPA: muconolactone Delta-isomerase family protein [Gaiellaceae bacterium]|nr:muconolactone Delta-isomerase family protein [Gaiellaceae bacterium]
MKFLITMRRRDGVPMPPEVIAGMLLAQRDWLQERLDDGTLDCAYTFAQGGGGCGIVNAESGEELARIVASSPLFGMSDIDVQPLADISTIEGSAAALRRAVGAPA